MILWPHLPVWPFFLIGCAVLYRFNRPAADVFVAYWIFFQVFKIIAPDQRAYFGFITVLAVVFFFYYERVAATFLALVGLCYGAHILGILPQFSKVILAELTITIGMLISGYFGPTPGTLVSGDTDFDRFFHSIPWLTPYHQRNS